MIKMMLSEAAIPAEAELTGEDVRFSGCSTDSREIQPGQMFIALRGERFDGHAFLNQARKAGACAALVERASGVDGMPLLVVDDSRKAMGRLARYWRGEFELPLIALTGSNGKTTVKEMLASILGLEAPVLSTRGNLNNDIGVPLTLFQLGREHRYAVIEMGANHPGEIAWLSDLARPTVALITQCAPAHLRGFGSIEGVARAKAEIFDGLLENGTAIINADDHYAAFWRKTAVTRRQLSFGIENKADVFATEIIFNTEKNSTDFLLHLPDFSAGISLPLPGIHNVLNALAAAACCIAVGVGGEVIKQGLEGISPVKGRMQVKFIKPGVRLFDDTYNANPTSLRAALQVLVQYPGRHWLVLGDMGELGEAEKELHREAGEAARKFGIDRLYAIGELSSHAVQGFGEGAQHFSRIEDLVNALKDDLSEGITILVKGSRAMAMERVINGLSGEN